MANGSYKRCARILANHPEGLSSPDFNALLKLESYESVTELVGEAGDVFLLHPLALHAASYNHMNIPRFLSNTYAPLKAPLVLSRAIRKDYSILEESIVDALAP